MATQLSQLPMTLDTTNFGTINIYCGAISPDNKFFAVGLSGAPYLAIFDMTTSPNWTRMSLPASTHSSSVDTLAFNPDGTRCVVCYRYSAINRWRCDVLYYNNGYISEWMGRSRCAK